MTDFADDAQLMETRERDVAIANIRGRMAKPPATGQPTDCRICDDPIEEARRAALPGVAFCLECQQGRERLGHLFPRSS